jgi:hypothetical protein
MATSPATPGCGEPADDRGSVRGSKSFVMDVHEDGRRHLRNLASRSLDPLGSPRLADPAVGYPERLHIDTLKGYLGEILAGIVAETLSPHDIDDWKVPGFPLALHDIAFDQLETCRVTGREPTTIPGQSGNDCLAFQLSDEGHVKRCLVCESKCSSAHSANLIADAHESIGKAVLTSLRKLIEILRIRGDDESRRWVDALQVLWLGEPNDEYEQCNMVVYVCGQHPKRSASWLSDTNPHLSYSSEQRLEAVEIHLHQVYDLVRRIYNTN